MRRKHLILASCIISALLLTFTFHVSADENVTADSGAASNSAPLLDSYFWDNYYLLPYIESTNQYINTGVNGSSELRIEIKLSDIKSNFEFPLYGSRTSYGVNQLSTVYAPASDNYAYNRYYFSFYNSGNSSNTENLAYNIVTIITDKNKCYVNGNLVNTFTYTEFDNDLPIYIFTQNSGGNPASLGQYKLYSFSIYDYASGDDGELVRYYYPAKSKSGDVIGLYDAVNKTFVTTSTSTAFISPTDDKVIHFQIGSFITAGLGWIGDILEYAITEPIILFFMAIGLCGVAFRWARRVYHF